MNEIKIKMQIEYEGFYCNGTNIYTYKNEEHKKNILMQQYFKVLQLRYDKLYINCFIGYEYNNTIIEYTYEDFIEDLIKYYLKANDENGDIYFLIFDKMESAKSFDEFTSFVEGIKEGLRENEK